MSQGSASAWRYVLRTWRLLTASFLASATVVLAGRTCSAAIGPAGRAAASAHARAPAETVIVRTRAVTVSRVWLETSAGLRTRAMLRVPNRAKPRSVAAIVIVGGFENGWRAAEWIDPAMDVVLLSVDYPFDGPRSRIPPREFLRRGGDFWRATRAMPSLLSEAAAFLVGRSDVDSNRVMIVGGSLGVPFALRAAESDQRFRGVALLYGSAGLGDWIARNLRGVPRWARQLFGAFVALLYHDYEPEVLISKVSPRPVLLVNAKDDERISEEGARRLYEAAGPPREQVWLTGRHIRPRDEELVVRLLRITLDWARRYGFLAGR